MTTTQTSTYSPIDAQTVWQQIPVRTRILLGINPRKLVASDTEVLLPIRDSYTRKVIVRLTGADLYDLEYGQIRKYEWKTVRTEAGVHCEDLSDALIRIVEG